MHWMRESLHPIRKRNWKDYKILVFLSAFVYSKKMNYERSREK